MRKLVLNAVLDHIEQSHDLIIGFASRFGAETVVVSEKKKLRIRVE